MKQTYFKSQPVLPAIRDAMAKDSRREEEVLPVHDFSSGNIARLLAQHRRDLRESVKHFLEVFKKAFVDSPKGLAYSPTGGTEVQKRDLIQYFRQVHDVLAKMTNV